MAARYRIGIDTGGTFTDIVARREAGWFRFRPASSLYLLANRPLRRAGAPANARYGDTDTRPPVFVFLSSA